MPYDPNHHCPKHCKTAVLEPKTLTMIGHFHTLSICAIQVDLRNRTLGLHRSYQQRAAATAHDVHPSSATATWHMERALARRLPARGAGTVGGGLS